ncbi:SsrA-binding protein SmpB [Candidatus Daviesbacteria bacterium]|nr:SsrA-binding protein SmpB [Candidatus Daviesbacteria bacterium]
MRIINKKALHNYHILEHLEAGVVLSGAEVKSIRTGRIDLGEAYVKILSGEAFLVGANIPRYNQAADNEYDAQKSRKLLLHKDQINSLIGKTSGKGVTLVPVSIYEKNNRFKVEVGLAKSKKEFDKRKIIKEKDHQRRIEQELRGKE